MVPTTRPRQEPSAASSTLPLCSPTRYREPNMASPATAPSSATTHGASARARLEPQPAGLDLGGVPALVDPALAPLGHLKCLTALVT